MRSVIREFYGISGWYALWSMRGRDPRPERDESWWAGVLEHRQLNREQNGASRQIYHQKHNGK